MDIQEALNDVRENGPWVSTEEFDENAPQTELGHIHFQNVHVSGHLIFCDLLIEPNEGRPVRLRRVEVGKLHDMTHEIQKGAKISAAYIERKPLPGSSVRDKVQDAWEVIHESWKSWGLKR